MSALLRFYPTAWRARYGDELTDLVGDGAPGMSASIDLLRGAVDAHRHPELVDPTVDQAIGSEPVSRQRFEDLRIARRLGTAAVVGSILWVVGFIIAANGPLVVDGNDSYLDGAAGMPFMLGALILLSAGLIGQLIRLPRTARVGRIGASTALLVAPVWGLGPWLLGWGLLTLIGLVMLALSAWWHSAWSATATVAFLGSAFIGLVFAAVAVLGFGPIGEGPDLVIAMAATFVPIWLIIGATLQTLPLVVEAPGIGASSTERLAGA